MSLAVSLHAPNDALRDQLVPINRKYPIAMLLESARNYIDAQSDNKRVVTIEYTLIAGVNDQPEHARELAELLRDFPCKINLIPFNEHPGSEFKRPGPNRIDQFQESLADHHYTAIVRHSLCTLCLRCIDTCPYGARFLDDTGGRVEVNPAMCQGCGDCATVCPNSASIVEGFSHRSLFGAIDGAMAM